MQLAVNTIISDYGLTWGIAGLCLLFIARLYVVRYRQRWTLTGSCTGTIMEMREMEVMEANLRFPMIKYTFNGAEYRGQSPTSLDAKRYKPGDVLELQVNPEEPTQFQIRASRSDLYKSILLLGFAAFFMVMMVKTIVETLLAG